MIVAVIHATFAPFHHQRLQTAGKLGHARGYRVSAIEIADSQNDYRWPRGLTHKTHCQHMTLFPGSDYWSLSYRRIRHAVHGALDKLQPDVVVLPGWGFRESLAGLGWCLRRGVARVLVSDSHPPDNPQTPIRMLLKGLLARRFQVGFGGGKPHVRYLARLGLPPDRCVVGCDVVDNELFAEGSRRWTANRPPPTKQPSLFSALRLLPRKNVLAVLEVLASSAPEWTWTIAGDGPHRAEIESKIARLDLGKRVQLVGHVDYFDLPRHYAQSHVYLQPSLSEPWGLAVNEAMASGLPVAVSRQCGCHEDLVQDGVNGITFEAKSHESIAAALRTLLHDRHRWAEMGQASQRIISGWGLELYARNLWQACETALSTPARGAKEKVVGKALSLAL